MRQETWVQFFSINEYSLFKIVTLLKDSKFGEWCKNQKDKTILLKPNLLSAKPPDNAITTHPIILEAVLNLIPLKSNNVIIADSPGGIIKGVKRVWENTGMQDLANRYKVELICIETSAQIKLAGKFGPYPITRLITEVDAWINLPKLKTHSLTYITGAVKNAYGLIPGLAKAQYHKSAPSPQEFAHVIADIYASFKPDWTLMDGIVGMDEEGPAAGRIVKPSVLILSPNALALDLAFLDFAKLDIKKSVITMECIKRGMKPSTIEEIKIIDKPLELNDFREPPTNFMNSISSSVVRFMGSLIWFRPKILKESYKKCRICVERCPVKAIKTDAKHFKIDYSKCILCLCCHELCPHNAIELDMSMLMKLRQKLLDIRNKIKSKFR